MVEEYSRFQPIAARARFIRLKITVHRRTGRILQCAVHGDGVYGLLIEATQQWWGHVNSNCRDNKEGTAIVPHDHSTQDKYVFEKVSSAREDPCRTGLVERVKDWPYVWPVAVRIS